MAQANDDIQAEPGRVRADVRRGDVVEARRGYFMPLNLPARVIRLVRLPHDDSKRPHEWVEIEGEGGYWPRFKFQRSA